ncbi:MAG: DUF4785 family protein [Holophagales bacterium]|nr:DUF4785 family protein [Holophagales bacterium]
MRTQIRESRAVRILALGCALLLGLGAAAQAENARLLSAEAGDLAGARELVTLPVEKGMIPDTPREPVTFTFPLPADKAISSAVEPFVAASREYFVDVPATDLAEGVEIFTTAPGALVRLAPAASAQARGEGKALALDPTRVVIEKGGIRLSAGEGLSLIVDAEKLAATGVPFAEGTVAFRLADELGAGATRIAVPGLSAERGAYTLHVFDKASSLALELTTGRADYFHGDTLKVEGRLPGARLSEVTGFVTSPAGRAYAIEFQDGDDLFRANLPLDALATSGRGLWEVHVATRARAGELTMMRSARTSFAAHLPTAGLTGEVSVARDRRGLYLGFGVEVGTAGRYEVRGVFYGTDSITGEMRPLAAAHAADWLDADGVLRLELGRDVANSSGLEAPFELRDLRLLDQGRMGVLHRQARALVIDR